MSFLRKNSFYKIIKETKLENKLTYTIQFDNNHSIYNGHFPNRPITPGVCILQILKELLELQLNNKLQLTKANNIKFIGMIDPIINNEADYNISYSFNNNQIETNTIINQQNNTVCKISSIYSIVN
jgi:3-hydroxyacyl-[acyl-carrier-protein] dehydratase